MIKNPLTARILPFATYMAFILIHDFTANFLAAPHLTAITYPLKILAVMIALAMCWKSCDELKLHSLDIKKFLMACAIGVLVFILWIHMDWDFAAMGEQAAYNPELLPKTWFYVFVGIRLFGASVIVPIFEELFWRSFILRYIINPDFLSIKIGAFTWTSFLISSVLFGVEHYLWLAGIMAGVLYNLLLYQTGGLWYCIIAHSITNFLLGIYVLKTGAWQFW